MLAHEIFFGLLQKTNRYNPKKGSNKTSTNKGKLNIFVKPFINVLSSYLSKGNTLIIDSRSKIRGN